MEPFWRKMPKISKVSKSETSNLWYVKKYTKIESIKSVCHGNTLVPSLGRGVMPKIEQK